MSIYYKKYQNKNEDSKAYGKWYARVQNMGKMVELEELAQHMSEHNTPFSKGAIAGVLTDMVGCIRELILEGKAVKLPNLAIFSAGISCKGADSPDKFSVQKNVRKVYLKSRATGTFSTADLSRNGHLKEMGDYTSPQDGEHGDSQNP